MRPAATGGLAHARSAGEGPTVVLLHGIGADHRAFAHTQATLADAGYQSLAWDMPGYGASPAPQAPGFAALAEALLALLAQHPSLRAQPQRPVVLVGHSMGAMVAQELAHRAPEWVAALVLCGSASAFGKGGNGEAAEAWRLDFLARRSHPLARGLSMAEVATALVPGLVGPHCPAPVQAQAVALMGALPAEAYRSALATLVQFDRQADWPGLAIPSLLIAGEHDRAAPPHAMRAMAEQNPHSRFLALADCGHLHNLEQPQTFERALLDFLSQLSGPQAERWRRP